MPYDPMMRWETEGGASHPTDAGEPAERPKGEGVERVDRPRPAHVRHPDGLRLPAVRPGLGR